MLRVFLNGLSSIQQNKLFLNIYSFLVQLVKTQRWMMDLFKLFHFFYYFQHSVQFHESCGNFITLIAFNRPKLIELVLIAGVTSCGFTGLNPFSEFIDVNLKKKKKLLLLIKTCR